MLVGPQQREFAVHKKLLCSASRYFQDSLNAGDPSTPSTGDDNGTILWFSDESPEMFELFIVWLYQRQTFQRLMDELITRVSPKAYLHSTPSVHTENRRRDLHWNFVRLHLFAALVKLPDLQDISMDALQDLYLRCDWEVSPRFVSFLYDECVPEEAFRLRKWAVAMMAWSAAEDDDKDKGNDQEKQQPDGDGSSGDPFAGKFKAALDSHPQLRQDYVMHLNKMVGSRADVRIKNPQLRLPGNALRSEERFFGFRQCSFHCHRRKVGEGVCPHAAAMLPLTHEIWAGPKYETETDESGLSSDESALSPGSAALPVRAFRSLT